MVINSKFWSINEIAKIPRPSLFNPVTLLLWTNAKKNTVLAMRLVLEKPINFTQNSHGQQLQHSHPITTFLLKKPFFLQDSDLTSKKKRNNSFKIKKTIKLVSLIVMMYDQQITLFFKFIIR